MLVPTAPSEPAGIVFGFGVLVAAGLFVVGWLPRLFLPRESAAEPLPEPLADLEETPYKPLYPDLSFENPYRPTPQTYTDQTYTDQTYTDPPPVEEVPSETEQHKPRRRRLVVAAAIAVLAVGIVGAIATFAAPSVPAAYEQFAVADLASKLSGIFADRTSDVIRDDALEFQTSGAAVRDGDFNADVDRWRPLAEQGNAAAQYKLGVMYANGRGTPRDYIEAYKWLNIAGALGNTRAIEGREAVARRMTPVEIERAQNLAREAFASAGGVRKAGGVPARIREMSPRDLVREAQSLLHAHGYDVGLADGIPGQRTRTAVRQFERREGLPVTGDITAELVTRMERTDLPRRSVTAKFRPALPPPPAVPASAPPRSAPVTECDRLAAHPSTGLRSGDVDGVVFARIDAARAIPACEQAAAQYPDELRFQFQLARSLHKADRHEDAIALYGKAGDQGFALAQRSVGFMYANGSGVAQDLAKAARWLRQAAERCDADAQFALGTIYAKGQGVERNEAESLRWFRIAAAQAHPDARDRLNAFANSSEKVTLGSGQTGASADDAALRARQKFEPGDYTAARHIDRLLAKQDRDVIDAFERKDYAGALGTLRPLAEQGAAPAQTLLGYMYREGLGVEQNDPDAVEWYRKAADQDDPDAEFLLGYMYQRGLGVPQYFARALQSYRKSAGNGVAAARVTLGDMYDNAQGIARDSDLASAQFIIAAEAGLAGGQHSLARAYETGDGVPRDLDEAIKWYRMAAAQNFALSQNRLGELYDQGKGVQRDNDEAVKWYRLAAEQGLPDAQFNLAKNYAAGRGVPRDRAEALKLYTAAAERGHAEGQFSVAIAHLKGRGVERSDKEAVAWFRRAAAQCNADAQYQLANLYRLGQGVPEASAAEELKWLKLAAEQGHAEALQALGLRYAEGKGVQQDAAKALKSMQRAAELGHADAQVELAEAYANGSSEIPQDYAKAAQWYQKAARQGNRDAQYRLAGLYRDGLGVARSYVEAVTWYRQAAEGGDPRAQHSLATAYRLGAGVEPNPAEAVVWYRQAAEQGDANSQRDLGLQYLHGTGVLQDFIQARLWLGLAAARGDAEAANTVDRLAKKMTPDQIAEADRLANDRLDQDS
jgi:TPR repeat protein